MASPEGVNAVLISWSPSFSAFSYDITYQVQVDLGESVQNISAGDSTMLTYTAQQLSCDPFQISVTAVNAAGMSNETSTDAMLMSSTCKWCIVYF